MSDITQITTYEDDAVERVLAQFKDSTVFQALIRSYVAQVQIAENQLFPLIAARSFDAATGHRLDGLGQIVGEPRNGKSDDTYRIFLRARMAVNLSQGTIGDLFKVLQALENNANENIVYNEIYPAAAEIRLLDEIQVGSKALLYNRFLQETRPAAVRLIYIWYPQSPDESFTFSSTSSSETDSSLGFGDAYDSDIGGKWIGAMGPGSGFLDTGVDAGDGSGDILYGLEF